MLSERKAAILQAVVEGYISTSEPVGSAQIVTAAGLDVSSATVRSEMGALEEAGYLHQPHTSAGRVPSEKGYRYFVDTLMEPATLGHQQQQRVSSFFGAAQGELERMLADTSSFLAQLTDYAALVVGPANERSPLIALQVVRLSTDQAMLVMVRSNAVIDKAIINLSADTSDEDLETAGAALVAYELHADPAPSTALSDSAKSLFSGLVETLEQPTSEQTSPLYVGGTSTVAGIFDAVGQVQEVLRVLEKQYLVVTLVKDIIDRGLNVAIGSETGVAPLAECSVVVAPIEVDGLAAGSIGLLGPTHMNYPEAMATVGLVSQRLSDHLREGSR